MAKYRVHVPYVAYKVYDVEADNKEDAESKAFNENDIESNLSVCWECSKMFDTDLEIREEDIEVEEI